MREFKKRILFLYLPLLIICIISLFNLYNLNYRRLFMKQIICYIIIIFIIVLFQKININKLFKLSWPIYIINIFLLILVLFWGNETNGAKAWLKIGMFSFQPSEFMKLSLSLLLASISSKLSLKTYKDEFILICKFFLIMIIPSILVFLEPDTGAIIFYIIITLTILFLILKHKSWFIIFGLIMIAFLGGFIYLYNFKRDLLINVMGTSIFYRIDRIINFKKNIGYQLNNALVVIGSAKLFYLHKHNILYIPEASTDFAFAYTIGNLGLIFGFIILIIYLFIIIYLLNLYDNLKNKKIKLFLISFINLFVFNIIYNIGMNLGLLPIMGIPLPFLSYGGSTMLIYALYLGILIKEYNRSINI